MLLFSCPNCGPRNETEFHYGGQAHVPYPEHPEELSDRQWAEYLFYRQNTKGVFAERWVHTAGCRQWFNMLRDTVSYDIKAVYRMGERPPAAFEQPRTFTTTRAPENTAPENTAPENAAPEGAKP